MKTKNKIDTKKTHKNKIHLFLLFVLRKTKKNISLHFQTDRFRTFSDRRWQVRLAQFP